MASSGRTSGVLLPLFSLRSERDVGVGDFGGFAGLFDWLERAGQKLVMVLPLLPTAPGDTSPYSTRSAFGLSPLFLDVTSLLERSGEKLTGEEEAMVAQARAAKQVRYDLVFRVKAQVTERCFARFEKTPNDEADFRAFCDREAAWLEDFALYTVLSEAQQRKAWWDWPAPLANREPQALSEARKTHARAIRFQQWQQWVLARQWQQVRALAKAKNVLLCGDEPFIIASDSADCWCHPHLLRKDSRLGVPPDDFSADGQDWGLPWFDFDAMEKDGYRWLKRRAQHAAATYDLRRVDHAIGYFRQYLRDEKTPKGRFIPDQEPQQRALGEKNFRVLAEGARIVAEDLGVIPRFAKDVLAQLQLPGYRVMRWSREDGVYQAPSGFPQVSLATTGTHDTDTLRDWWQTTQPWEREAMARAWPQLGEVSAAPGPEWTPAVHQALLRAALESASELCILPWQDVFGELERVNLPASVGDHNWSYRMVPTTESLLSREDTVRAADWLRGLTERAGRL